MKTEKQIKLKSGEILPAGLPVRFENEEARQCLVQGSRPEPYRVRTTAAFRAPSIEQLEDGCNDGVCETVAGGQAEPDGWDDQGSPSWLLALGMI